MALGSKEGIASCLLLKLHILQIIKYAEDPLDSDSDGETLEGEAPDSKQGNSKIQNVFEQFYHYMNMCNSRAVYPKIERIINYVKQFQKTEEVLNFTKNEAMLKFLFRPVLSSEIGKGEETPRKSHRKLSDPSTELLQSQISEWTKDLTPKLKILQSKLGQNAQSQSEKSQFGILTEKMRFVKILVEFLEKKVFAKEEEFGEIEERVDDGSESDNVGEGVMERIEVGVMTEEVEKRDKGEQFEVKRVETVETMTDELEELEETEEQRKTPRELEIIPPTKSEDFIKIEEHKAPVSLSTPSLSSSQNISIPYDLSGRVSKFEGEVKSRNDFRTSYLTPSSSGKGSGYLNRNHIPLYRSREDLNYRSTLTPKSPLSQPSYLNSRRSSQERLGSSSRFYTTNLVTPSRSSQFLPRANFGIRSRNPVGTPSGAPVRSSAHSYKPYHTGNYYRSRYF